MFIKLLRLLLLFSTVLSSTSYAITLDVMATATGSGAPGSQSVSAQSGIIQANAQSAAIYPGGSSISTGIAADDGRMAVAAVGLGDSFLANGTSVFSQSFTNSTTSLQSYSVDFLVTAGVIQYINFFEDPAINWARSSMEAEILIGTTVLWSTNATVEQLPSSAASFTESGTSLSGTYMIDPTSTSYAWANYADTVQFDLSPGENTVFSYRMNIETEGNITCPQPGIAPPPGTPPCPGADSVPNSSSRIGDPFDFAANPAAIGDITLTSTVPVPPALWLFGSGLMGLISLTRCRKS